MNSKISTGKVNEIISKIDKIFEEYNVSEFQQVSILEAMKFDMYLSNIKKRMK